MSVLAGLRVLEVSAFVAAPLGGATLAGMGADVIRVDPVGGGIDRDRWPLHAGRSLYWAGLNQGKRSVTLDARSARGRELLAALAGAVGTVLTNLPAGALSWEELSARRPDLVLVAITGNPDGSAAVDYTVNAAAGWPFVTGPAELEGPVNHVLPAWDVATGFLAAAALLAADRHRRLTGAGQRVGISLADVALAVTAHLGAVAEAVLEAEPRPRVGNDTYGTLGRDVRTRDGRHLMVLALTPRQWRSLCVAVGMDFPAEFVREDVRFQRRTEVWAVLEPWVAGRTLAEVADAFDRHEVLWGPYRTFQQLVAEEPRLRENPMFAEIEQPGVGRWPATSSPVQFGAAPRLPPRRAPDLGEHTAEVLTEVLGLGRAELADLRTQRIIG
ncbi:MAG: 2-methylfumaryl-CoA isomerase [Chloroflexi bacterium]|nr:MAG: 2-methylfumaryl-CoA isomerase [Chloroflexota bacterium]